MTAGTDVSTDRGGARPDDLTPERIEAVKSFRDSVPPAVWANHEERQRILDRLPSRRGAALGETISRLFSPDRDWASLVESLKATVGFAIAHGRSTGSVASVGYCLGGRLSAELACADRTLLGAVVYYGSAPPKKHVSSVGCPLLGFYGGADVEITKGVPAFAQAVREAGGSFEYRVYSGAPHAFFNDTRPSFDVGPARDSWARTLVFLAGVLG